MTAAQIDHRRAIIDRRALADAMAALPDEGLTAAATALLQAALRDGRAEVARRLELFPGRGRSAAAATAFLHDQLLRLAFDLVTERLFPNPNPSTSERIALIVADNDEAPGEQFAMVRSARGDRQHPLQFFGPGAGSDHLARSAGTPGFEQGEGG